jgi:hypothetical protein
VLVRAGDFPNGIFFHRGSVRSHDRRSRGVRYSGTTINARHVSPFLPSREACVKKKKKTHHREEKAQHAKETPTLRRNATWCHD